MNSSYNPSEPDKNSSNIAGQFRNNMVSPSILQQPNHNTSFQQPKSTVNQNFPPPNQNSINRSMSVPNSGVLNPNPPHNLPNPPSNDNWFYNQEHHLKKQIDEANSNLMIYENFLKNKSTEISDEDKNKVSFLRKNLENCKTALSRHYSNRKPSPAPAPPQTQPSMPQPPNFIKTEVRNPPDFNGQIVKPAVVNGQKTNLVQVPATSKTVLFSSEDGNVQKLTIPCGFDVERMPNGQVVLVPSKIKEEKKEPTPNFPAPTMQQTIDRVSREAEMYTNAINEARRNGQPRPTPPVWLNRTDFIMSQKELNKCQDLQDPCMPKMPILSKIKEEDFDNENSMHSKTSEDQELERYLLEQEMQQQNLMFSPKIQNPVEKRKFPSEDRDLKPNKRQKQNEPKANNLIPNNAAMRIQKMAQNTDSTKKTNNSVNLTLGQELVK